MFYARRILGLYVVCFHLCVSLDLDSYIIMGETYFGLDGFFEYVSPKYDKELATIKQTH